MTHPPDPKVSIIIPVFNGANYVREAIDSAIAQTYQNLEILVINDGSTDGGRTEDIAKSYGSRIRYFSKPNGGVASALNFGIRVMTGEYVSWLSHDDLYFPDKIRMQIGHIQDSGRMESISCCGYEDFSDSGKVLGQYFIHPDSDTALCILRACIGGCCLLIPKVCFDRVGFFNERMRTTQDNEMWLRMTQAGFVFRFLPEILVRSRVHQEQDSHRLKPLHLKEKNRLYRWALDSLGETIQKEYGSFLFLLDSINRWGDVKKILRIPKRHLLWAKGTFLFSLLQRRVHLFSYRVKGAFPFLFKLLKGRQEIDYCRKDSPGKPLPLDLSTFQAKVLNSFVSEQGLQSVLEFGCGDGRHLPHCRFPEYIGLDSSGSAIEHCRNRFASEHPRKAFFHYQGRDSLGNLPPGVADLTMVLDFPLSAIQEKNSLEGLRDLFFWSARFVFICSSHFESGWACLPPRIRSIPEVVGSTFPDFTLFRKGFLLRGEKTLSEFYLFERREALLKHENPHRSF